MKSKKTLILFIVYLLIGLAVFGQSINISKPAASVNLIKAEMISVQQLENQIGAINALKMSAGQPASELSKKEKLEVLDMMIADVIIMQGAERDGIKAEKEELKNAIANQKAQYEQQRQRTYTDEQFKAEVERESSYSWKKYVEQLEKQIVQQKYILAKKQEDIKKSIKMPDNSDIDKFYRENKTKFTNPEMVRYSQIFISTLNLDQNGKKEAEDKAEMVYRKFQNGTSTFEQLVNDYTEDQAAKYRNGDSGYIAYNDPNAVAYLGNTFMDSLFKLKKGEVSAVVKSKIGYHIIKVTDAREAKILGLDDAILPTVNQTVREYIAQQLIVQIQNNAVSIALNQLVSELEKEAVIKIFEENID